MARKPQQPLRTAGDPINENIETIARIEKRFLEERSVPDRIADAIAGFSGSMKFVGMHAAGFLIYIVWNLGVVPHLPAFDPYPFMLLSMVVGVAAAIAGAGMVNTDAGRFTADGRKRLKLSTASVAES